MSDDYPALARSLLTPLAERYGLDYGVETTAHYEGADKAAGVAELLRYRGPAPGVSDESIAFALVTRGADLLSYYRDPEGIYATSGRSAKRAAKWVAQSFDTDEGRTAAIFLAQAFGTEMSRLMALNGFSDDAGRHLELVELVQRHYPLGEPMRSEMLAKASAEYDVLATREPPDTPTTGFHVALMDGVEPDDELVEAQASYAGQYFRHLAGSSAIRLAIGEKRYAKIAGDLLPPGVPDYAAMVHVRTEARWWLDVGEDWQQVGLRYTTREAGDDTAAG